MRFGRTAFSKMENILIDSLANSSLNLHKKSSATSRANKYTYDKLLDAVGNARVVLIGEASHGTSEFYFHRAEISKRLIMEKGFNLIGCEVKQIIIRWPTPLCFYPFISLLLSIPCFHPSAPDRLPPPATRAHIKYTYFIFSH